MIDFTSHVKRFSSTTTTTTTTTTTSSTVSSQILNVALVDL